MKKIHRLGAALAVATAALTLSAPAAAQFAKTEDAIKYRQAAFALMGNHMGRLAAMAKGEKPFDAAAARSSAQLVATLAGLPWEAFPAGSGTGAAKVKGDPWANAADFKSLQEKAGAEIGKLAQSVDSLEGLRKQLGATGASCKACHDKYRGN
jgi:cytochrome c556